MIETPQFQLTTAHFKESEKELLVRKLQFNDCSDSTQLKPLSTRLLKPFRHNHAKDPNSYIKLTDRGELVIYIAPQDKFIVFSPDGQKVTVRSKVYSINKLPSKLVPWYKYALNAVEIVRATTVYATLKCQHNSAMIMLTGLVEI